MITFHNSFIVHLNALVFARNKVFNFLKSR